jgi:hypothetical protein
LWSLSSKNQINQSISRRSRSEARESLPGQDGPSSRKLDLPPPRAGERRILQGAPYCTRACSRATWKKKCEEKKKKKKKKKTIFAPMMIFLLFSFFRHGLVEGVRQTARSVIEDHRRGNARHAVATPHAHPARQQKEKIKRKKNRKNLLFFSLVLVSVLCRTVHSLAESTI